jgi:hypothetical protein
VAIKPKALSMEEAASIPLVGSTAWQALIERASLKHGQNILIHAGSGGVGFAHVLRDYDVVLQPGQGDAREISASAEPGGQLISISGPPEAAFARSIGASWVLRMIMGALSYGD